MVLLQFLEIELCTMPIPKGNELTDPRTPVPVSFARSMERRLGAIHQDRCWAMCFFPDLEGKCGEKVPQSIVLRGYYATLEKQHVPLKNLHEPGHLEDLVTTLFSCPMSWNASQHGVSNRQHLGWWPLLPAIIYKDSSTCHWRNSPDLPLPNPEAF